MGARSVASVVVSFGGYSVGVKLYLSADADQVSFNMINPKTGHRVKQVLVDEDDYDEETKAIKKAETEVIPRNATLKGYEYAKGKYITFTDEEVANFAAEKRDTLDLVEFVPLSEINPLHVEKTLYSQPDKGMDKGYTILYETLKRHNKAAVGTWVSRGKEHLVMIRAYQHGLIVHQMFYDTEIRAFENNCKPYTPTAIELAMSKVMIDQFSKDSFDKSKYSDKFSEKVTAAVNTKLNGGQITAATVSVSTTGLADKLRASLIAMGIPESQIDALVAKAQADAGEVAAPAPVVVAEPVKVKGRKKAAAK